MYQYEHLIARPFTPSKTESVRHMASLLFLLKSEILASRAKVIRNVLYWGIMSLGYVRIVQDINEDHSFASRVVSTCFVIAVAAFFVARRLRSGK